MIRTRGLTLVELVVALAILAVAVFPLIRIFSQSYSLASKQSFQEQALKIAESAIAKLMAVRFETLDSPDGAVNLPFEVISSSGSVNGSIELAGSPASGTGSVSIGRVTYGVQVSVARQYEGPAGGAKALMFTYAIASETGPLSPVIATYSCPDPFLRLEVTVQNPEGQAVRLTTFRADLRR